MSVRSKLLFAGPITVLLAFGALSLTSKQTGAKYQFLSKAQFIESDTRSYSCGEVDENTSYVLKKPIREVALDATPELARKGLVLHSNSASDFEWTGNGEAVTLSTRIISGEASTAIQCTWPAQATWMENAFEWFQSLFAVPLKPPPKD